ncbi:synaptopodin-2 isoform X2 [Cololabis saira]|uniref:synaptopodin-2 isoform X2 n=1 Tax=Cololabis saira TaxID=129043 RepID=UPI002AD22E73|nr:synaptopodin-2 isoform X2 [Cololabis saira]
MEPGEDSLDTSENIIPPSGSDASQELCVSESLAGSYGEDDDSDDRYHLEPQSPHNPTSGPESPEALQLQDWECGEPPEPEPHVGQTSWQHSRSFSSSSASLGGADVTQALTLCAEQPQGTRNRQDPQTGSRRVESSEEGGSSEAPPASVFSGISDECAEQAEKKKSGSDTDPCRPGRHRVRHTRFRRNESQSERHVKETKSKCKQIAQLLTNAPNPQNKGALLFKKRRQRVKNYTLVSYGTGFLASDSEDQVEGNSDEGRGAGCNVEASGDSDPEEHRCLYYEQRHLSENWESFQEMQELPEIKGKGGFMFAQRRKRMDGLVSDREEQSQVAQNIYDAKEMYVHAEETKYMDDNLKTYLEYHEDIQQMNNVSNMPKPLVPNRTAKPFLGLHDGIDPVQKKHEPRFKVPVPINTHPKVWSPTGDIIASRDERISVPAIKTGILPESKRRSANKQSSAQKSGSHIQNKGDRRSYIESEDDCFSLGAEACNFMQPRAMKLKNPPPVAPKPSINPASLPWMRSTSNEPYIPPRSPISQPSHSPVAAHSQHYLQKQDWVQPQQMANHWASDQTQASLQTPANVWTPLSSSSKLHLPPTTNSSGQPQPRSPGFGRSCSLSLPRRPSSGPYPGFLSPASTLGLQPSFLSTQRQTSFPQQVCKPPTPWEAASKSPLGSVEEAFGFQSFPSSVASTVKAAAHHRSLPEPPDEWKRRVSLDSAAAVRRNHYLPAVPASQALPMSRTFSSEKQAFDGPPFRPGQPLRPASRASTGNAAQGSSPTKYSHWLSAVQPR